MSTDRIENFNTIPPSLRKAMENYRSHMEYHELWNMYKKVIHENSKMKVFLSAFAGGNSLRGCSKEKVIGIFEVLQSQARDLLNEVENEQ